MTEIMPVPRNLNFTVLPAGSLPVLFFVFSAETCEFFIQFVYRIDGSPKSIAKL